MSETQPATTVHSLRSHPAARPVYAEHKATLLQELANLESRSAKLIRLRIGTAIPGILMVIIGMAEPRLGSWTWQLGLGLIALFLVFATLYENLQWRIQKHKSELFGIDRLLHRCDRNWQELKPLPAETLTSRFETEWTKDLDIFGDRSLFRWASLAMTQSGTETVAQNLQEWASPEIIQQRQEAVQELVPAQQWRLSFFQIACGLRNQYSQPEGIVSWVESPSYFEKRTGLKRATVMGPCLAIGGSLLLIVSLLLPWATGQLIGMALTLLGFGINFFISMFAIGPVHNLFNQIGHANRELQQLQDWIQCVEDMPRQSKQLAHIHSQLLGSGSSAGSTPAITGIQRLQRIMAKAGLQKSPVFFIPYSILQVSLLWDIRVLEKLEQWKKEFRTKVPAWFQALGSLESLNSAAAIADEYPNWTYPVILGKSSTPSQFVMRATGVAHPLLKDHVRVANDIEIADPQRLVLVTGSNMAGKSTLLRSVGINSVLARLGAPICSESWTSESFDLASSIRVQDSLQDGVSFFMAELKRLRRVVDQASAEAHENGHRMLVLLDEILQGTNSRERQIAVDSVLRRLVELGCVVLASTHDLELASSDQMQNFAQIVHFREYFEEQDGKQLMRFDYKMRPGVTPTTNALKLLEMVGL